MRTTVDISRSRSRPEAVIRTAGPIFTVPHLEKTFRGALRSDRPGRDGVPVKAGDGGPRILLRDAGGLLTQGFGRGLDVGLCLSDGNGDGAFDAVLPVSQFVHRIRSPFELIRGGAATATMPVSVPTEKLAPERIPLVLLRARFYNDGAGPDHLLFGQIETLRLEVCYAGDHAGRARSGLQQHLRRDGLDVQSPAARQSRRHRGALCHSPKTGETDTTTWGPVAIAITGLDKKKITAHVPATLPPGPLTSWVANVMILGAISAARYISAT